MTKLEKVQTVVHCLALENLAKRSGGWKWLFFRLASDHVKTFHQNGRLVMVIRVGAEYASRGEGERGGVRFLRGHRGRKALSFNMTISNAITLLSSDLTFILYVI